MMRVIFAAAAALGVAACAETGEPVKQTGNETAAAVDERNLMQALGSAVDEEAVKGLARGVVDGAVRETIQEALPAQEIAAVRAVVDEEALAKGLDQAIDDQALRSAAKDALDRMTGERVMQ